VALCTKGNRRDETGLDPALPYEENGIARMPEHGSFASLPYSGFCCGWPRPDVVSGYGTPVSRPKRLSSGPLRHAPTSSSTDLCPRAWWTWRRSRRVRTVKVMRALDAFSIACSGIIMLWRHTDQYVESLGSSEKILWLPHGVELGSDTRRSQLHRNASGCGSLSCIWVFVGSMALENILEAARILP